MDKATAKAAAKAAAAEIKAEKKQKADEAKAEKKRLADEKKATKAAEKKRKADEKTAAKEAKKNGGKAPAPAPAPSPAKDAPLAAADAPASPGAAEEGADVPATPASPASPAATSNAYIDGATLVAGGGSTSNLNALFADTGQNSVARAWAAAVAAGAASNSGGAISAWKVDASGLDEDAHTSYGETESCMIYEGALTNIKTAAAHYEYAGDVTTVPVVVKTLTPELPAVLTDAFLAEAEAMKEVIHPNVLMMIGCDLDGDEKMLVFEAYANGALKTYLAAIKNTAVATAALQCAMARDVASGMAFLASKGVVHGDLAARTCLVEGNNRVRVGDYGLARQKFASDYPSVAVGGSAAAPLPIRWMAPETMADVSVLNTQSDVWSFGVAVWEIITMANNPYARKGSSQVAKHVAQGGRLEEPKAGAPAGLFAAGSAPCFAEDPSDRPTFADLHAALVKLAAEAAAAAAASATPAPEPAYVEPSDSVAGVIQDADAAALAALAALAAADGEPSAFDKARRGKQSFRMMQNFKDSDNPAEEFEKVAGPASDIPKIARSTIVLSKELGEGAFGVVMMGKMTGEDGEVTTCACKTLKSGSVSGEDMDALVAETQLMIGFDHPNVVKCFGMSDDGDPAMIVLEFCPNGSLFSYLTDLPAAPSLKALMKMAIDIAAGMEYLAVNGNVHRDLATRNILVDANCASKISDFGLSRDLDDEMYYESEGGMVPIRWTPPEAYKFKKYSSASDVWSYGITLYEVWTKGGLPYGRKWTNMNVMMQVEGGYRLPPPAGCPKAVYKLMMQCWNPLRKKRPSFTKIHDNLQVAFDFMYPDDEDGGADEVEVEVDTSYGGMEEMYLGVPCPAEENLDMDDDDTYMVPTDNAYMVPTPTTAAGRASGAGKSSAISSMAAQLGSDLLSPVSSKPDRFAKQHLTPNGGVDRNSILYAPGSPSMAHARRDAGGGIDLRRQKGAHDDDGVEDRGKSSANLKKVSEVTQLSNELNAQSTAEVTGVGLLEQHGIQATGRQFAETTGRALDVGHKALGRKGKGGGKGKCICRRFKCVCSPAQLGLE